MLEAAKPGPFSLAGRVVSVRDFGKAAFVVIQDRSGTLQVHVKKDALGEEAFKVWKLVDLADFIGVKGTLFKSKTGELTLAATELRFLGKALRPLPGDHRRRRQWDVVWPGAAVVGDGGGVVQWPEIPLGHFTGESG